MTVLFELASEFLDQEDIPLTSDDLKYGLEHGWLRPRTVIDQAVRGVERGDDDPVLMAVASLLSDEVDDLPDVVAQLDSPDHIRDPRESARKWLYLQLKAAYDRRQELGDPLGVVEELYADFDYPPRIEGFVRYMPVRQGEEATVEGLMARWEQYLRREGDALRSGITSP